MSLVDMKSNLAINAGKPLGSPVGRHDPDPDLKKSLLDSVAIDDKSYTRASPVVINAGSSIFLISFICVL